MGTKLIEPYLCMKRKIDSFGQNDRTMPRAFIHFLCLSRSVSGLFPYGQPDFSFFFHISILPRKSVYNTVSGVIDAQMRPLSSSSASKHSPRNRQIFIKKNCTRQTGNTWLWTSNEYLLSRYCKALECLGMKRIQRLHRLCL
jgi:hypothetical protein